MKLAYCELLIHNEHLNVPVVDSDAGCSLLNILNCTLKLNVQKKVKCMVCNSYPNKTAIFKMCALYHPISLTRLLKSIRYIFKC